jgi:peptidoglycan/xylan/chitin deacetylase (PgdA/CDA1 family)
VSRMSLSVMALRGKVGRALPGFAGVPLSYLVAGAFRWSRRHVGLAVMYHRVGDPQGDPRRELVPAYGTRLFEAQVRHLKRCYRVVAASELLPAINARRRGERIPVAITFDDDLSSHTEVAMPILKRLGVTATFFLSGASLAEPFRFWWERLQVAMDSGAAADLVPAMVGQSHAGPALHPGVDDIHSVAASIEALPAAERDRLAQELGARVGPDPSHAGMRSNEVRALAAGGFEIGFHTLRHDALIWLDDEQLGRAMTNGRDALASVVGRGLNTIGYPHGKADGRVASAARAAGYEFGFTTSGAAIRPETDPLLIGRIEPSFGSVGAFGLQLVRALI